MRVYIGPYTDDGEEQEVNVQIDGYDTWSGDYTLAKIIHPFLLKLKEEKQGTPWIDADSEDVPENLRRPPERDTDNDIVVDDAWGARWDYVLNEMIWAFEQYNIPDYEEQFCSGVTDMVFVPIQGTSYYSMEPGPNHTYKLDVDGLKAHNDRMDNGVRLFGKYYRSLWS